MYFDHFSHSNLHLDLHLDLHDHLRAFARLPIAVAVFGLLFLGALPAHPATPEACDGARPAAIDRSVDGRLAAAGEVDVYRFELTRPGVLAVEATGLDFRSPTPEVTFLGRGCVAEASNVSLFTHRGRHVHDVAEPGTYHVAVTGGAELPYRLRIGFAGEAHATRDGNPPPPPVEEPTDEWEEGSTGDPTALGTVLLGRDGDDPPPPPPVEEPTDEWEEGSTAPPLAGSGLLAFRGRDGVKRLADLHAGGAPSALPVTATGGGVELRFYPVCRRADGDDAMADLHADGFGCASELELGDAVTAELRHGTTADRDTFTFVVRSPATVVLGSAGDVDLRGALFDRRGDLVADDDDGGDGVNFRIRRRLAPGRYYLRVDGAGWEEGVYTLRTGSIAGLPAAGAGGR